MDAHNCSNLTAYTAGANLQDKSNRYTVIANDSDVHYAYILVDYVPGLAATSYPGTDATTP